MLHYVGGVKCAFITLRDAYPSEPGQFAERPFQLLDVGFQTEVARQLDVVGINQAFDAYVLSGADSDGSRRRDALSCHNSEEGSWSDGHGHAHCSSAPVLPPLH